MTDIVIRVEGLGKRYQLRGSEPRSNEHCERSPRGWRGLWRRFQGQYRRGTDDQRSDIFWAIKDISFSVERGEVLGVIGENGSGKSTLLKILSGITDPTTGTADITGRMGSLLEVGTGFHPELTGRENTYLNGAILGIKNAEIRRRFDEIVAFAEVEKFIDTPVKFYSSGMYVRLAFAVAAHLEPEILLLDEVLAVGDAAFQRKCLGKMGAVAQAGRTVLFVSHNLAAVRNLCGRTLLLESGALEKIGPTEEVISHYLSKTAVELTSSVALPACSPDDPGRGCKLHFFNVERLPQAQFRLGEPWRIVVEFELYRSVPHVIAAVGLISLESVPLITYWSKPKDLRPGRYCVEFECELPLAACEIQFAVGLSSYERPFYYVQGIGHVSISPVAVREQPFRTSGSGMLMSLRQSEIHPVVAEERAAS
ncbi:MAG TPA: polysaccharide ABC transporter ATP-binding protein [Nitrospira sp.]|nr:polysaccharide ABC transporter ATP-binding protein [Nitrospira sp.]